MKRLEMLNKSGAVSPSDLYDMRGQLRADQLTVLATKNALESARLELAQLMNIPCTGGMRLAPFPDAPPVPYRGSVDSIYASTLQHLALVAAAGLRRKSAEKAVKVARGDLGPTLSVAAGLYNNYSSAATTEQRIGTSDETNGQYVLLNNDRLPVYQPVSRYREVSVPYGDQWKNNFNSGVSLNLSIPVFNGLRARGKVRLGKIAASQAAFRERVVKTRLRQAVERDYLAMQHAYQAYRQLVSQVADYSESFREAKVKFEAGVLDAVAFVLVENNLVRARLNLITVKYQYLAETRILDYYQGKYSW